MAEVEVKVEGVFAVRGCCHDLWQESVNNLARQREKGYKINKDLEYNQQREREIPSIPSCHFGKCRWVEIIKYIE